MRKDIASVLLETRWRLTYTQLAVANAECHHAQKGVEMEDWVLDQVKKLLVLIYETSVDQNKW